MGKRRLVYVPLDDLLRAARNPKDHATEVIAASITRFGYVEPQIIDERTGRLVAGHGRLDDLLARREQHMDAPEGIVVTKGTWTVPVIYGWRSTDDDEAHALGITLNRGPELGGWKRDLLYEDLSTLAARGIEWLTGTGFGQSDIDDLHLMAGVPDTLAALKDKLGKADERDFWPVLHLTVSPSVKADWDQLCADLSIDDTNERIQRLIVLARAGLVIE